LIIVVSLLLALGVDDASSTKANVIAIFEVSLYNTAKLASSTAACVRDHVLGRIRAKQRLKSDTQKINRHRAKYTSEKFAPFATETIEESRRCVDEIFTA
jgi:hypothetical protein